MLIRPRLLLLLPFAPRLDAAHGGGRVVAQFLAEITAEYTVAILYLRSPDEPCLDDFFRDRCELVEEVIRPPIGGALRPRLLRYLRLIAALARLRPMWVADWASQSYGKQVRLMIRKFQPDIVQVEYHVMGQYLSALDGCDAPRVLVEHEPGGRAAPYIRNLPPILANLIQWLEKVAWKRYETAVLRQVQAIIVFTDSDRQAVKKLAGETPIYVIPPGVRMPDQALNPLGYPPPSLLFIGNFIHPPNMDAAVWLAQTIFPCIQTHIPEIKLFIVGDQPPPEIKAMAGDNIVVTGRVPDVAPYLDRAALFVAPLRSGGGMRIKVLEALAAGKAVVATPLAAEGLGVVDGRQISLAENGSELVERTLELLANPEKRLALARQARAWACEHLGWDKPVRRYQALYADLLK